MTDNSRNPIDLLLTYMLDKCPVCGGKFVEGKADPRVCPKCGDFCCIDKQLMRWDREIMRWVQLDYGTSREKVVFT